MIDDTTFKRTWALLCDRFNREPSKPVMLAYFGVLNEQMTTEEFKRAAHQVFIEREFFPRPIDFLNAARPDPRAAALEQWEKVQVYISGTDVELDDEARRAVTLMGGRRQLGMAPTDQLSWIRKEFLQLYGETAEIARREQRTRIEPSEAARQLTSEVKLKALR